jgi:hypothetical protein
MMDGSKLSNFKIGGPILQNGKNRVLKLQLIQTFTQDAKMKTSKSLY